MPAAAPMTKPTRTRQSVAQTWVHNSPVSARPQSVAMMRLGGGTRRPLREAEADGGLPEERDGDGQ